MSEVICTHCGNHVLIRDPAAGELGDLTLKLAAAERERDGALSAWREAQTGVDELQARADAAEQDAASLRERIKELEALLGR